MSPYKYIYIYPSGLITNNYFRPLIEIHDTYLKTKSPDKQEEKWKVEERFFLN